DRLAVSPAPRQTIRADGEEFSAGGEEQNLVRRLGVEGQLEAVAFLECQRRKIGKMPLHRAQPALLRYDDRDGLALDHRLLDILDIVVGRIGKLGATAAEHRGRAEAIAQLLDLPADGLPLLVFRSQQSVDLRLFGGKSVVLLTDL